MQAIIGKYPSEYRVQNMHWYINGNLDEQIIIKNIHSEPHLGYRKGGGIVDVDFLTRNNAHR